MASKTNWLFSMARFASKDGICINSFGCWFSNSEYTIRVSMFSMALCVCFLHMCMCVFLIFGVCVCVWNSCELWINLYKEWMKHPYTTLKYSTAIFLLIVLGFSHAIGFISSVLCDFFPVISILQIFFFFFHWPLFSLDFHTAVSHKNIHRNCIVVCSVCLHVALR